MEKVIFLDRDGTLNAEVNYLHRPEDLQLLPGVPGALRRLKEAGYKLVVVTNQAGWPADIIKKRMWMPFTGI